MKTHPFNWPVIFFTSAVVVVGSVGMVYKMTEFTMTIIKDEIAGFGVVALSVYFAGMMPLLFLSLWGLCRGHFRNIERPKFRMIELDDLLERRRNVVPRPGEIPS